MHKAGVRGGRCLADPILARRRYLGLMSEIDPNELARALSEVPLFREIQKLLSSQTGPVNWEIARQVARSIAGAGAPSKAPTPADLTGIETACRAAELRVTERTGLEATSPTTAEVLDRVAWAERSLEGFAPLIDRLAIRLGGQIQPAGPTSLPGMLGALAPFLLGLQVGFLVGYLSRRVLGQYDLCYPASSEGRLYFVYPNIVEVENELQVDPEQFRMWLAIHEVTHQLEFQAVGWTKTHFVSLIERYIDSAEIDSAEVAERLRGLADPEQLEHLMQHPDQLLPMLMSPAQEAALSEIQAFMSVLEGFAEWAMNVVGSELLDQFDKMREGINRRRAEKSSVERMLEQLLGLDLKREQYRAGEKFITAIAAAGEDGFARLWEGPENLPTLEEINEPSKWLSRVVFS